MKRFRVKTPFVSETAQADGTLKRVEIAKGDVEAEGDVLEAIENVLVPAGLAVPVSTETSKSKSKGKTPTEKESG